MSGKGCSKQAFINNIKFQILNQTIAHQSSCLKNTVFGANFSRKKPRIVANPVQFFCKLRHTSLVSHGCGSLLPGSVLSRYSWVFFIIDTLLLHIVYVTTNAQMFFFFLLMSEQTNRFAPEKNTVYIRVCVHILHTHICSQREYVEWSKEYVVVLFSTPPPLSA